MESPDPISIHSDSSEPVLGQGAAGTVRIYNSPRKGPIARKMLVIKGCYEREKFYLELCRTLKEEPLYKYTIECLGCFTKSDTQFCIDFELAATDLHRAAVNVNDTPTKCTQWFPDADSFDRAITNTLSGLMLFARAR